MTETKYPQKFVDDSDAKKVIFIQPPDPYLGDCKNCGGIGHLSAFYPSKGPFNYVPHAGEGEIIKSVTDSQYGWVWYTGKTFDEPCDQCGGMGKDPNHKWQPPMSKREYEEINPIERMKDLGDKMRVPKRKINTYEDYTV